MASTTLALMLQITAANGASGILQRLKQNVLDLRDTSKEASRHFDSMTKSLANAGKSFAVGFYLKNKIEPGIKAAADLEEAMNNVKGNIAQIGDKTEDLAAKLKQVRDTGREVSKVMPFSATEVVNIEGSLAKAGVDISAIAGPRGAAYAAAGLASVSGTDPNEVGDMLARIGKQYDFKPTEYKSAADLLMRGEAASPGNLQEVMYSLKQFGATAKLLHVSFKDSVTMAAAMAPLGLESGTAVNRFILDSSGLTKQQRESMIKLGLARMHSGKFENLLYQNGHYIGLDAQIKMMRGAFAKVPQDQVKVKLAHDIWGQEGMRAALMAGTGDNIFENMKTQMDQSLGLEDRMKIKMDGLNMAAKAAAGTIQTLLAQSFDPALSKATALANKVNDIADKGASNLSNHPDANKAVAYAGAGVVAAAMGYGIYQAGKSLLHGAALIKELAKNGGKKGVGKALLGAAGGTPVFVTNWPGSQLDPGERLRQKRNSLPKLPESFAGGAAGGGLAETAKKSLNLKALLGGVGAFGLGALPLAAIGGAAYWASDTSNDKGRVSVAQAVGTEINKLLSFFGMNKQAAWDERLRRNRAELGGEPIRVVVDVKNGNIVASVAEAQAREARRN